MLKLNSITHQNEIFSFNKFSFSIEQGEFISVESSLSQTHSLIRLILSKEKISVGNIDIGIEDNRDLLEKIGIIYYQDNFYERMKVIEYLKLFQGIFRTKIEIKTVLNNFGLNEVQKKSISQLNDFEKRKLSLAREYLKTPVLMLIVEPIKDLNDVQTKEIIKILNYINNQNITVITFSTSNKEVIMLSQNQYELTEIGFKNLNKNTNKNNFRLSLKLADKVLLLEPSEINYIESFEGKCLVITKNDKIQVYKTLNEIEEELRFFGFFRTHRSFLVNTKKISQISSWTKDSYYVILNDQNKTTIPVSKGRVNEIKYYLTQKQ